MPSYMLTDFIAFSYKRRFLIAFGELYGMKDSSAKEETISEPLVCDKCGETETTVCTMVENREGTKYILDLPANVYLLNPVQRE